MENEFIGAFVEMTPSVNEKGVDFRFGWEGLDAMDDDTVELLKNLVAGIFGMMTTQDDDVIEVGKLVRKVSAFDESIEPVNDNEIMFTADEELLTEVEAETKIIDLKTFKPNKNQKH